MKNKIRWSPALSLAVAAMLISLNAQFSIAQAQGTAFTYQGKLVSDAGAASGVYDFTFAVWNAGSAGAQQGSTVATNGVAVTNGYFLVTLDFGNVFPGTARWLEIAVRTNGSSSFTTLAPRQLLTPTPYAITASNLSGTLPAIQLSGTVGNSQLANNAITVTAGTGLAGGGTVPLGGATTLNNAGVLSVTGNADITATALGGAVTLDDTATDANIASRIVKRDGSGNFSAGTVTLAGNLNLPATTGSSGAIYAGGFLLAHDFGYQNFFAGLGAGNLTMTGSGNVGVGSSVLSSNVGGADNAALGYFALAANISGNYNTAIGQYALFNNTNGYDQTAVGDWALRNMPSGNDNTAIGNQALQYLTNGIFNTALGSYAGYSILSGNYNIDIGNNGLAGDSQKIRIGTQGTQTNTFIAGIYNTPLASGSPVFVDHNGQLGTGSGSTVTVGANETFTGVVNMTNISNTFAGDGTGLTGVAKLMANQTFYGTNHFASQLIVNSGPIDLSLFTGLAFQYYASGEGAIMSSYNDGFGYLTFYTKQGAGYPIAKQVRIDKWGGVAIDQQDNNNGVLNNSTTNGVGLTFGTGSGEGIASKRTGGGNQYGLDFYTGFANRMSISQSGNVCLNSNALIVQGINSTGNGLQYFTGLQGNIPGGGAGPLLFGWNGGALGSIGPTEVSLSWDYVGNVWISNNCSVATLTIRGGSDLAEPFDISGDEVSEGAVVVIDEQNPGHLKLSDSAYDTHVAGVVSGAKGIHPGIQMHQEGLLEGGQNVALTGRVYVKADTSNGAIHPGDLLTTSGTRGHAMKVTDHAKAGGAILGKAMTGLKDGEGMVLVLVTLQ